jgi:hypothetical protein
MEEGRGRDWFTERVDACLCVYVTCWDELDLEIVWSTSHLAKIVYNRGRGGECGMECGRACGGSHGRR